MGKYINMCFVGTCCAKLVCVLKSYGLFFFLLLMLNNYITLGVLHTNLSVAGYDGGNIYRLADSILLALPILFSHRKWFVLSFLLIINLYFLSILWYFQVYATIMPLASYLMFDNLRGLGPSIFHSIHFSSLEIITPSICFFCIYLYSVSSGVRKEKKGSIRIVLLVALTILMGVVSAPYWPNKRAFYEQPLYLFGIVEVGAFKYYGLINYWIYETAAFRSVSDEMKGYAQDFINELPVTNPFPSCNMLVGERKNLIIILVESLQSWPINLKIDDIEVTPNINGLLDQANTVYFPKVLSQVKDGRSSDAQLLINTGLLPLATGAASSLCANNTYPSIASALRQKHYFSASFICDEKTFWNQGATTISYGFDQLYDQMQGEKERKMADENLFKEALFIIKKMSFPFYAQLVTLSSHEPYTEPIMEHSLLREKKFKDNEIRNYLIAIQYVDKCIADFVTGLKREGIFDKSIIVITGDHEQVTYNKYKGREQLEAEDCYVPFIIINSPLSSKHTDKVFGQVDIYPSLLNMMGCCDYQWKGLGESVFGDCVSDYTTYRTGLAAGGEKAFNSVKKYREKCWNVSDILLRMDYFK